MVEVRPYDAGDRDGVIALLHEMQVHYEGDGAMSPAQIGTRFDAALPAATGVMLLIAVSRAAVVGFLSAMPVFPGRDLLPTWWVKDLYVSARARRTGAGKALMERFLALVAERGGVRVDLVTDDDNAAALAFYQRLGARQVTKTYLRFEEAALSRFAGPRGAAT